MTAPFEPFSEPLGTTLKRTIAIALVAGLVFTLATRGSLARWPISALIMMWPSFGGHWVDLWYLNWLRPRLPADSSVHVVARLATWFAAGCVFGVGMALTASAFSYRPVPLPRWWLAGIGFIIVELVAHLGLRLRGRPSFYALGG